MHAQSLRYLFLIYFDIDSIVDIFTHLLEFTSHSPMAHERIFDPQLSIILLSI